MLLQNVFVHVTWLLCGSLLAVGLVFLVHSCGEVLGYMAMQRYSDFKYDELVTSKYDTPLPIMLLSIT